jgi:hypothetical protein
MSRGILDAVRDRRGQTPAVAVRVDDPSRGINCWLHVRRHFDAASVVKTIILGALLRKAHTEHRWLTRRDRNLAWQMITESDNDAATALWNDVGMYRLHRFLHLTGMGETRLNPAAWGMTRITAHDETVLLQHLLLPNPVLTTRARRYELWLMARVIPAERWGVTAGAPDDFTAHVKNGWAPLPSWGSPWWINSTGCFTHPGKDYTIVGSPGSTRTRPPGSAPSRTSRSGSTATSTRGRGPWCRTPRRTRRGPGRTSRSRRHPRPAGERNHTPRVPGLRPRRDDRAGASLAGHVTGARPAVAPGGVARGLVLSIVPGHPWKVGSGGQRRLHTAAQMSANGRRRAAST